jgi:hypothetical protein
MGGMSRVYVAIRGHKPYIYIYNIHMNSGHALGGEDGAEEELEDAEHEAHDVGAGHQHVLHPDEAVQHLLWDSGV